MPTLGVNSGTAPIRLCDARVYRGSKSPINAKVAIIQAARYLKSPIDVGFVGLAPSHSDPVKVHECGLRSIPPPSHSVVA
jgi:hypothetical protein